MQAIFVHEGTAIDYRPTADVAAGSVVVLGELIGIAKSNIKAGELGALAVAGVFDFTKANGSGTAIALGALVYWDATQNQATTVSSGNKLLGKCVQAASDSDSRVRVRLS